jgi:kynurenine formamidase
VLLGADVLLIENLMRLPELPPDGFTVSAFPIRIVGENGAPVRVVAELPG